MCPKLETPRLALRPPGKDDIAPMVTLLGDYDVAKNLGTAPHPYREEHARAFLERLEERRAKGEDHVFSILDKEGGLFMGCCGAHLKADGFHVGYWLGKPYWGSGVMSEAAKRLVCFLFKDLKAERLHAGWFHDNPASGRVLAKLGFVHVDDSPHECLARGHDVLCHNMVLMRENFGRKRNTA